MAKLLCMLVLVASVGMPESSASNHFTSMRKATASVGGGVKNPWRTRARLASVITTLNQKIS